MKAPDVIYLQWHGDAPTTYLDENDNEIPIPEDEMDRDADPDSATWCADRIYEADIPYRRDDQVCVWRHQVIDSKHGRLAFLVSDCKPGYSRVVEGDYCSFCGRRIRVEES
jgi:hypothetical protein